MFTMRQVGDFLVLVPFFALDLLIITGIAFLIIQTVIYLREEWRR